MRLNIDLKTNFDTLTKGERMKVRETVKSLAAVDLRCSRDNKRYMVNYIAFQNVGDFPKRWLSIDDRNRITEVYETLKKVLRDGHETIGHAMIARGLKKPEDFDL